MFRFSAYRTLTFTAHEELSIQIHTYRNFTGFSDYYYFLLTILQTSLLLRFTMHAHNTHTRIRTIIHTANTHFYTITRKQRRSRSREKFFKNKLTIIHKSALARNTLKLIHIHNKYWLRTSETKIKKNKIKNPLCS